MDIREYLAHVEKNYSSEYCTVGQTWNGPGYHSQVPNGTWVHPTRQAFDYALMLLESGEQDYISRSADTLTKLLTFQDTNPVNPTYGIFPWLMEEPLEQMSPPDWNWADFCGAIIAQIIQDHSDKLPADLVSQLRQSLGHAAWSIFRRNVQPNYTNIAFMGTAVTAAAGEILDESRLLDYARKRLDNIVNYTDHHGGLNEYNSPCYTFVALHECERILQLVKDQDIARQAEQMRFFIWQSLAEHFHPATAQLAGPHSRTYSDLLTLPNANYMEKQTELPIACHNDTFKAQLIPSTLKHLPCPLDLVARFRELPQENFSIKRRFIRREPDELSTYGTTWFSKQACLGSVNYDTFWVQCRPLIGYWTSDDNQIAVFKARFLHDGKDCASAWSRNAQKDNSLLSVVGLLTDRGDHHCHLDAPENAVFTAEDFRVSYELTAPNCSAEQLSDGSFQLTAGDHCVHIKPIIAKFNGKDIAWQLNQNDSCVSLDAICYTGPKADFPFKKLDTTVFAVTTQLLPTNTPASDTPAKLQLTDDQLNINWPIDQALTIDCPSRPTLHGEE